MKKGIGYLTWLAFGATVLVSGCDADLVPLKGTYKTDLSEIMTDHSVDSTWAVIERVFASGGLPLKSVNKRTGNVVTKKIPLNSTYTFEDGQGRMESPDAWVVMEKVYNKNHFWKPKDIYSTWCIQVDSSGSGARVRVDPYVECTYHPNAFVVMGSSAWSTGKLEGLLARALSHGR
jgi:hypothetical protein